MKSIVLGLCMAIMCVGSAFATDCGVQAVVAQPQSSLFFSSRFVLPQVAPQVVVQSPQFLVAPQRVLVQPQRVVVQEPLLLQRQRVVVRQPVVVERQRVIQRPVLLRSRVVVH